MEVKILVTAVLKEAAGIALPEDVVDRQRLVSRLLFCMSYEDALALEMRGELDIRGGVSLLEQRELAEANPTWEVEAFTRAACRVLGNHSRRRLQAAPQARQRFRALSYLVVYPDIDAHIARNGRPPWVDATSINFSRLTQLYKAQLRYRETDSIYSLDDFIDEGDAVRARREDMAQLDAFAAHVLKPTLRVQNEVVAVRDRWSRLDRVHPVRTYVPPPAFLGIVTEHRGYEDWLRWEQFVTLNVLDCRVDESAAALLGKKPAPPKSQLPPRLRAELEAIFKIPFEAEADFLRLQHSRLPAWLGGGCGDAAPFASWKPSATA